MAIVSMLYGAGGASSAEDVSYDNTTSGLEADNVQDAIDEVVSGLQDCIIVDSYEYVEGDYSVHFYKYSNGMKYMNARKNNTSWDWGTQIFQIPDNKAEWRPKADMIVSCVLVGQAVPICNGNFMTSGLINASVPYASRYTGAAVAFTWYI